MNDILISDRFELEMIESDFVKQEYEYILTDRECGDRCTLEIIPVTEISAAYLINIGFMIFLKLRHQFLLFYREVRLDGCFGLVLMEYCEKDNIEVWMHDEDRVLDEKEVINISAQIIEGLSFLNDKGIVHRNIEPRNILLNHKCEVKLANYGVETEKSYGFIAAEVIEKGEYSLASDIFSTGCTMYYLATRRAPFVGTTSVSTITKVFKGEYPLITEGNYSNNLKLLIYSMLNKDPTKRPCMLTLKNNALIRCALEALPTPTIVPMPSDSFDYLPLYKCYYGVGADATSTLTPSFTKDVPTEDTLATSLPEQAATFPSKTSKSFVNDIEEL